jgi:ribosome-associated protein
MNKKTTTQDFELNGEEFIPLNLLLKCLQLVETGGMANQCITAGLILVNGEVEYQKRKKIRAGDVVEFEGDRVVVK